MPRWLSRAAVLAVTSSLLACSDDARLGIGRERETSSDWMIVECADFNADGLADVLWYSPTKNAISVWTMGGTQVRRRGFEIPGPSGRTWRAVPVQEEAADFNFDDMADVLWYNPREDVVMVWLMRGTEVLQKGRELDTPPAARGWDLGVVGDFDADDKSGVSFHNVRESSQIMWTDIGIDSAVKGDPIPAPRGPGWDAIIGLDFNGDNASDVLWYNAARNVMSISLIWGRGLLQQGPEIPGPSGTGWVPVGASDLNGDHLADIVWFNPGRNVMEAWLMAGTIVREKGPEIPGPSGGRFVLPALADFNGDLLSDAIWLDQDTGRFSVWLMRGTEVMEAGPVMAGPGASGGY